MSKVHSTAYDDGRVYLSAECSTSRFTWPLLPIGSKVSFYVNEIDDRTPNNDGPFGGRGEVVGHALVNAPDAVALHVIDSDQGFVLRASWAIREV